MKSILSNNLVHLREMSCFELDQVACAIGWSGTHVRKLEADTLAKPSYQLLKKLADLYGVKVDELVDTDLTGKRQDEVILLSAIHNLWLLDTESLLTILSGCRGLIVVLANMGAFRENRTAMITNKRNENGRNTIDLRFKIC